MEKAIIAAGRELAKLDAGNAVLKRARDWWRRGRKSDYANHDFDILNSLVAEASRIRNGWR